MGKQASFKVTATRAEIAAFSDTFEHFCTENGIAQPVLRAFQIAFDEVLTNVADYAYGGAGGEIDVRVALDANVLAAEVIDSGPEFDPLQSAPPPDLDSDIEDRAIGGLGLHLVTAMMDEVSYRRSTQHNHLRLKKFL